MRKTGSDRRTARRDAAYGSGPTVAQAAAAASAMKTIGTPSGAAKPEIVPPLFVFNSRGAAGTVAYGAAAFAAPYARPVCGYYPYPPCY